MGDTTRSRRVTVEPPAGAARLLGVTNRAGLEGHLERCGPRPQGTRSLIAEVEQSGLRGRGGAGFPTAVKLASVSGRRQPVLVANATEGEPLSAKDKTLLTSAPHLVLDGAALAAEAIGASRVVVCVEAVASGAAGALRSAVAERESRRCDDHRFEVLLTPSRFVAGEETALVNWLNGRDAKPAMVPPRPFERGVSGRPTLVQNVETLAHIALIARFGAGWFRGVGTRADPGTRLLTVGGGVAGPGVFEVTSGLGLGEVLAAAGMAPGFTPPVLVGGYFGAWLHPDEVAVAAMDSGSLGRLGASPGCGVVWALPPQVCGLAESARVADWYAAQSAGQCGPCANGLPAIAHAFTVLVAGNDPGGATAAARRWAKMVTGRGACRHPDGAARFVTSALRVFASEIDSHARRGPCLASRNPGVMPTPVMSGWR